MLLTIFAMSIGTFAFGQTVGPPAQVSPKDAVASEKLVCKRVNETGRLATRKRVCLTAVQWDEVSRQGQEVGRAMQPALTTPSQ